MPERESDPTLPQRKRISDERLDDLVTSIRNDFGVTGASVALVHRGRPRAAASGTANAALASTMTTDTVLQIGSTTKVYTAVLMLQLVDAGLLDIDAPVAQVLPDVRLARDPAAARITPRQLMSMSSGLNNGPYADTGGGDDAIERYVALLADIPLLFDPGTGYSYSNASTVVSGRIIEQLTGLTWHEALRDRLLRPAGLLDSLSTCDRLPYRRISVGHTPDGEVVDHDWTFSYGMAPTGSTLTTTAADLARFGQLFLRDGLAQDGTRVLSVESVRTLQTPQVSVPPRWFADDWCVGPYRKIWDGVEAFGHGGTTEHGSSTLTWIPELDLSVAIIVNNPSLGYPFAHAVLDSIVGSWFGVDKPHRPVADPTVEIDPALYVGTYTSSIADYEVADGPDGLQLTMSGDGSERPIVSALRPVGDHRFLATDDRITSFHNWDVAFSGFETGPARLFHNGAFAAARRT